jgi:hypothetical protein
MIGDGTPMILLKVAIGSEIKMLFIICADKHQMQFMNYNLMGFLSLEHSKEKFIKEHLEDKV